MSSSMAFSAALIWYSAHEEKESNFTRFDDIDSDALAAEFSAIVSRNRDLIPREEIPSRVFQALPRQLSQEIVIDLLEREVVTLDDVFGWVRPPFEEIGYDRGHLESFVDARSLLPYRRDDTANKILQFLDRVESEPVPRTQDRTTENATDA